ncbi:MAG: sugar ABC transporter substrate-binding protein [Armatimonadetes bacterium]|nr:sugar ABC transporter substrate-binding protein [Armatimonadota bacterium]
MKQLFLAMFLVLAILSVVAQVTKPSREFAGRTRIIWTTDDNPARQAQIDIFDQQFPHLKLTIDPANNDMSKIIVQTMAGIGPDVIDCYNRMQLHTYYQAGILEDITDWAKEAGTTPDVCWESARENMMIEGRQYGFPTNPGPWVIFYNKDIFDKAGLPYPSGDWTWDEFVDVAKKLTLKEPGSRRNTTYGIMGYDIMEAIWQNGGSLYNKDGTRCALDSPEAIEAAQWLMDLQFVHGCAPSPSEEEAMAAAGGWGQGIITLFDAGRLGMIRYGRWGLIVWRKNPKLRIGVCPLPYRKQKATTFVTRISVLNKKSPYKREAFNFMKFLASEDYGNQINDSADNLAPVKRLCYLDRFLHNPQYPQEDYNEVFRDEMACAKSVELSKFSNPFVVDRIFRRYIDLMRNKEMTAVDAMTAAAKEINESIEENVAKFPELQAEYDKLTGSH